MKQEGQNKDYIAYAVSGLAGFLICYLILIDSGKKEVWDNSIYYPIGIPVMCLLIAGLSYFAPVKAWRWSLAMALGQTSAMWIAGGSMNLWPISIIMMIVMSLPQFITGFLVSQFLSQKQ
ncbi:MAG: hypothetical protein G3M70_15050 [Candidatus Nitronauta litoralis]|uniref:Uncharacterized protein n=1 Tax=Candidatus Nitronauta litoralis TaxID=2705533 RepID=A0A7T0G1Q5_9BACT|nr:MAG: hypothetical protein G3M70_15050 [Candidatus Nitronauta litoralis]